ncbi:MAG: Hsp70 family protein [Micromonosporaceae bacterium]|nr:Hsp70 family protein [Micromonosporaceae bacterium]
MFPSALADHADGCVLGIDFGTTNTVAVLGWPDGRVRPLLFDGSPLLPSAVCLNASGVLLAGRDALQALLSSPERFEPHPKRRIDDGVLLLGGVQVPVGAAIEAVLGRVAEEARRVGGGPPKRVVLTHPASWYARRQGVLADAARRAGMPGAQLVAEPLAAAFHFADLLGERIPVGGHLVVYDFGAGTLDASVLRRTAEGFAVVASAGLADAGGLDVDAAVVAHFGAVYAERDRAGWQRLERPASPADRRLRQQLWDGVRAAKESLSRAGSALVHVPVLEVDAPLGRDQLEQLARPVVDRSVAAVRGVLLDAGLAPGDLAAVVLVGGASRMPMAATCLHRAFGIAPTALEQPELVVAEGSLRTVPDLAPPTVPARVAAPPVATAAAAPPPAVSTPGPVATPAAPPEPAVTTLGPRWVRLAAAAAAVVLLLVGAVVGLERLFSADGGGGRGNAGGGAVTGGGHGIPAAGGTAAVGASAGTGGSPGPSARSAGPSGGSGVRSGPGGPGGAGGGAASPTRGSQSTTNAGWVNSPAPLYWNADAHSVVARIGIRMTPDSGSGVPMPDYEIEAYLNGRVTTPAYAGDLLIWPARTSLTISWSVETHKCTGELVDSKSYSGAYSDFEEPEIDVTNYSGSFYSAATVTSLTVTLNGVTWHGSSATATTPCLTL